MSIEMSIARTSMSLSEFKLQQALQTEMMKKTMEMQEMQIQSLISKLPDVTSAAGSIVDTKA